MERGAAEQRARHNGARRVGRHSALQPEAPIAVLMRHGGHLERCKTPQRTVSRAAGDV